MDKNNIGSKGKTIIEKQGGKIVTQTKNRDFTYLFKYGYEPKKRNLR